jgi:hypothetical protein
MIGRLPGISVCVVALTLLAACTSSRPTRVVTVTKTPTSATPTATTPPAESLTPTATPTLLTQLKGTCDTLLTDDSVFHAIGVTDLPGEDEFVVGKPEPAIHRLAYLNCRYGVTGKHATPAIEIGISLYSTGATAASRITATVEDYEAHGASSSEENVDGLPATMLTGGVGDGYDVPTLVVASGQRTVAVSIDDAVASGDKAVTDATALAALALKRTTP